MTDIRYEEEHDLLRQEARRWLAERAPIAEVRRLLQDERGDDPASWRELCELGWVGLVLPESCGGAGLGIGHLAVLLEESGRSLLPSPLLPATLAGLAIEFGASEAQRAAWLPALASGDELATIAHVEPDGAWAFDATRCERKDGAISGEKRMVWGGATAHWLIVPFRQEGRLRLARIDATRDGVARRPELAIDPTRRSAAISLQEVAVSDDDILEVDANEVFAHLLPRACTALAAEQAGGADALLVMTAAYAATRKQFGRAIGSFQAVKHPLVNALVGIEQSRSLVYAAAAAIDSGDPDAEELARMAKAHVSDVYVSTASRAIQLHGGFGFTIDCDAHLYFKRAQASRPAWGDAHYHRRWIAKHLID